MKFVLSSSSDFAGFLIAMLLLATAVIGQSGENGKIVERTKYSFPEYEKVTEIKKVFSKQEYDEAISARFETERLAYLSDGLKVTAYLYRPKAIGKTKFPVIVFNRGSYIRGDIAAELVPIFHRLAIQGFVVIAPLYRGSDGAKGKDEVGGGDLADLASIEPLIKSIEFADAQNIFLYGESRGGMMVYQSLRDGFPANAAATYGAFSDFDALVTANSSQYLPLLKSIWADYEARKAEIAQRRSAIQWADRINTPLLLMHGGADRSVDPVQTLKFAEKLQELKKPYELIVYSGDNHTLLRNQLDRDARVAAWFKKHIKK